MFENNETMTLNSFFMFIQLKINKIKQNEIPNIFFMDLKVIYYKLYSTKKKEREQKCFIN